jgi:Ala-tRNA(Pro) deacylase
MILARFAILRATRNPAAVLDAGGPVPWVTHSGRIDSGAEAVMRPRSLDEFLTKNRVPYTTFRHAPAFTAMHAAAISHIPGRSWAKTVVCYADGEVVLAVVPAHYTVDLEQLRELTGAASVRLASEPEFAALYPDCEEGAMPPFGGLYLQRVFVEACFVGDPEMVFNAGTHTDCIRMHYADFADLAQPVVGRFSRPRVEAHPAES